MNYQVPLPKDGTSWQAATQRWDILAAKNFYIKAPLTQRWNILASSHQKMGHLGSQGARYNYHLDKHT